MSRTFECNKCESKNVSVVFQKSYSLDPSENHGQLYCHCRTCDYEWNEFPSDHPAMIQLRTDSIGK